MSTSMYATPAELKAEMNINVTTYDAVLTKALEGATLCLDQICNRPDGFVSDAVASARVFSGSGKNYQYIPECTSISLVAVKESITATTYTSWDTTDWISFRGDLEFPDFNSTPYEGLFIDFANGSESIFTSGRMSGGGGWGSGDRSAVVIAQPTVQVTAKWGYATTCPADIHEVCMMQAARWYKRFQSGMSDTMATAEFGALMYRQVIDPDVKLILSNGRRIRVMVPRY